MHRTQTRRPSAHSAFSAVKGDPFSVTSMIGKTLNELLVLSSVRSGPKHGYQIALDVESRSGGMFELQHGTLYPILHRLEREGLLKGSWTRGGGRDRKEYSLTRAGRRRLGEESGRMRAAFERLVEMLEEASDESVRARPAES